MGQHKREDELDIIAKQVAGPNVRVKDPELFSTVLNESLKEFHQQHQETALSGVPTLQPTGSISVSPSPLPVEEPLAPFIGQGGLLDPEKLKGFALGFPEMASYLQPYLVGQQIRDMPVGDSTLAEQGRVMEPAIESDIARQYARQLGGPEIPEWVPFAGGMTVPEALAGGLASLTSPFDVGVTAATAGVGPGVSTLLKGARAAMPKSVLGKLGSVPLWGVEKLTAPITTGPFQKRFAKEMGIALPFTTTLEGVAKRKEEGIAAPWENVATAMLTSLGIVVAPQAARGVVKGLAKSFQPEVAFAKTDEPIDDILQNEVFKSHYELISPAQKKFVDNFITNSTKSSALTERQTEFLFEKLLKSYNRNKIIKTVESLPDTDPKKQQVQKIVKTLDDIEKREVKRKPKPLEIEYEEKIEPNVKGKLARVFEHNGRVYKIFKAATQWDPDSKKGTPTLLSESQQGLIKRLLVAIRTGSSATARQLETAKNQFRREGEELRTRVYRQSIEEGKTPIQAVSASYKALKELKADKIAKGQEVPVNLRFDPAGENKVLYEVMVPKGLKNIPFDPHYDPHKRYSTFSSYGVDVSDPKQVSLFNVEEVTDLTQAIHLNIPNDLDKEKAILALVKLMGDPNYGKGTQRIPKFSLEAKIPNGEEINLLKKAFGNELVNEILKLKRESSRKFGTFIMPELKIKGRGIERQRVDPLQALDQLRAIPKVLKATFDISAFLLQNGYFAITRPKPSGKAFKIGLRAGLEPIIEAFFDPEVHRIKLKELYSRPNVQRLMDGGLETTDLTSPRLIDREEGFLPSLVEKLPTWTVIGPIVRASSRFHAGFLNAVRAEVGDSIMKQLQDVGADMTDDLVADIAKYSNWGTGRGPKWAGKHAEVVIGVMNRLLFSYRLQTARIVMPFTGLSIGSRGSKYLLGTGPIRRVILKDKLKYAIFLGTVLGLAQWGSEIKDSIQVDWKKGKIRFGKQSFDFDSGYLQYIELFENMLFPESKASTGIPYTKDRLVTLVNTIKGKLDPAVSMGLEGITGKDFMGQAIDWEEYNPVDFGEGWTSRLGKIADKYLLSLNVMEFFEALKVTQNPLLATLALATDTVGIMTQSYVTKNDIALENYGKKYTELYPFEQKFVTTSFYVDDRVNRDIPSSLQFQHEFMQKMYVIKKNYENGTLTKDQMVDAYYDAKKYKFVAKDVTRRNLWDEQDREEFDYEEYIGGNEMQKKALMEHYDLLDNPKVNLPKEDGTPSGVINWDEYDKFKQQSRMTWTREQHLYVSANTNIYEALIPDVIYNELPRKEQNKIRDSWRARALLSEGRLQVNLQDAFNEAFTRINKK